MRGLSLQGVVAGLTLLALVICLPAGAQPELELDSVEWVLAVCDGRPVPPGARVTARFADGNVGGSGGVNRYSGSYAVDGQGLRIGPLASTMMAGPGHLMRLEAEFTAALQAARTVRIADGRLELYDAAGARRLIFHAPPQPPAEALTGVEWRLQEMEGQPLPPDAAITAAFLQGRVSGHGGVNRYWGSYILAGGTLRISDIGSTKMAGPAHLMGVEMRYFNALQATRAFHVTGDRLELHGGPGRLLLVFSRASESQEDLLTGVEWRLREVDRKPVPADAVATATFNEGQISGSGGVNQYWAACTVEGNRLRVSELVSTKMAGPGHLMGVEISLFNALNAVRTYRITDRGLELYDEAGGARLLFAAGPHDLPAPEPEPVELGLPLDLLDDQLWVPLRAMSEWMGATLAWNASVRRATVVKDGAWLMVDAGTNTARSQAGQWTPESRFLRPNGLMYVPLQVLAETFGMKVIHPPDDHVLILELDGRRGSLTAP